MNIRTAVIGFGTGGQVFHAPFLAADERYSLDIIVTSNRGRAAEAAARYPTARVVPTVDDLFRMAADLDLVVVGTPPDSHVPLAHRALDHGLAVVVDKPLCISVEEGRELVERAEKLGRPLTVFQNRRWDGDFRTVRALIDDGSFGAVRRFESRFEWWKPQETKAWKAQATAAEGGGILYDLGPHLIDQAIQLFGPVATAHAELAAHRRNGGADDDAFVSLRHTSGVRSQLWMNGMAAQVGARFHVLGSKSAYTKWGLDGQEAALKSGADPSDPGYGIEPEWAWGVLGVDGALQRVPTQRGHYGRFYELLADALLDGGPLPVDPRDAVEVMAIIERIHRTVPIDRPSREDLDS